MGIDNIQKLERIAEGSYKVTCDNSCGSEVVSGSDISVGQVCLNKYPNRAESFLKLHGQIKFTTYSVGGYYHNNSDIFIDSRYILKRNSKYHHTLEDIKENTIAECLLSRSGNTYKFSWFDEANESVSFEFDEDDTILKISTKNFKAITGHFDDPEKLKLELDKRDIRDRCKS